MMGIANNHLSIPTFISNPCTKTAHMKKNNFLCTCANLREFQLSAIEMMDVKHLERQFKKDGLSFTGIDNSCVVRMEVANGSSATVMLPSGLITSFKPKMWHGATMEVLHTFVSQSSTGEPVIRGGLSLALELQSEATGVAWCPGGWTLSQVDKSQESIQVELMSSSDQDESVVVKHVITLEPDVLNSEIIVSNTTGSSSHRVTGSAMCHLAVSTPDAAYMGGLQGSDYLIRPPLETDFSIIPSDFQKTDPRPRNSWDKLFSQLVGARNKNVGDDAERLGRDLKEKLMGEEDDDFKHLTKKLCRVYTNAPRSLTIIDRGRRNSVSLRREGFEEVYIFSPGSEHEWYSNYSYICIAHSALLQPLVLNAGTEWTGQLQLLNPNS